MLLKLTFKFIVKCCVTSLKFGFSSASQWLLCFLCTFFFSVSTSFAFILVVFFNHHKEFCYVFVFPEDCYFTAKSWAVLGYYPLTPPTKLFYLYKIMYSCSLHLSSTVFSEWLKGPYRRKGKLVYDCVSICYLHKKFLGCIFSSYGGVWSPSWFFGALEQKLKVASSNELKKEETSIVFYGLTDSLSYIQ